MAPGGYSPDDLVRPPLSTRSTGCSREAPAGCWPAPLNLSPRAPVPHREPGEVAVEGHDLRAVLDRDGADDGVGHEVTRSLRIAARAPGAASGPGPRRRPRDPASERRRRRCARPRRPPGSTMPQRAHRTERPAQAVQIGLHLDQGADRFSEQSTDRFYLPDARVEGSAAPRSRRRGRPGGEGRRPLDALTPPARALFVTSRSWVNTSIDASIPTVATRATSHDTGTVRRGGGVIAGREPVPGLLIGGRGGTAASRAAACPSGCPRGGTGRRRR